MSREAHQIEPGDILPPEAYRAQRKKLRQAIMALRAKRRVFVGPHAVFSFESFETLRQQIQEMLHIEGAAPGQLEEEMEAYNPLVPKGGNLTATLMFEIDSPSARARILTRLAGVEKHIFMKVGGVHMQARADLTADAEHQARRTGSVHFLRFDLPPAAITNFCNPAIEVVVGFDHPEYRHHTLPDMGCRAELARDFG